MNAVRVLGGTALAIACLGAPVDAQNPSAGVVPPADSAAAGPALDQIMSPATQAKMIWITGAVYQTDTDHHVDATQRLVRLCAGRPTCEFPVNSKFIGNDPMPGAAKRLVVTWLCGTEQKSLMVADEATATLGCGFSPTYDENSARVGNPYLRVHLVRADGHDCQSRCAMDIQCHAWSYEPPGGRGDRLPLCSLDAGNPPPTNTPGAASGIMRPADTAAQAFAPAAPQQSAIKLRPQQ